MSTDTPVAADASPDAAAFLFTFDQLESLQQLERHVERNPLDEISLTAMLLGVVAGVTLLQTYYQRNTDHWQIFLYIFFLASFHFLEYYITARYNTQKVKASSFLLRNGIAYTIAHSISLLEYLVGVLILSSTYSQFVAYSWLTTPLGLLLVVAGQLVRSLAMIQASSNFSHIVATRRAEKHQLVTHGVYSIFRHPSYAGFFYWALGTQILLRNPFSFVLFAVLLWRFFKERIEDEEQYLLVFFGKEYKTYRETTPTLIPFI
ncbi:hypothetical protein DV113_004151 [Geotrichum candidum]|uniref:Protein-S-isoprenylcysteine O-methyltransferase n=1 Tax=Geotrichum candidum TaxID=1173061 RepID=A0A0J9X336_GEOCN|nr:hypothetical protein DV454_005048 [Geotrichum candidum]KAF7497803.1 hypothetical protein DV113_004151 [Geotrichum candidum]CDO51094.1 similar to Saccharomyces cerevisiae YDR410C STE14 Farnesyl cysteine-carboxyl methyltransferase [Geotrichum candidum]